MASFKRKSQSPQARTPQRDIVKAEIGDNVSGVAVGKNIIQIGTLKVSRWFLIVGTIAVVIGVILLVLIAQSTVTFAPKRMPDETFNIAVAEFKTIDAEGMETSNEDGEILAQTAATNLEGQSSELTKIFERSITVWGPENDVGLIAAGEEAKRVEALNADVLIYGSIQEKRNGESELYLKFYLRDRTKDDLAADRVGDLAGEHALGTAIDYRSGSNAAIKEINRKLRVRLEGLSQLLLGLSYLSSGNEAGYDKAIETYEEVLTDTEWGQSSEENGKEALYLFLGNAYVQRLFYLEQNAAPISELDNDIQKAKEAFEKAVAINPGYLRAQSGIGGMLERSARLPTLEGDYCNWDWALLGEAQQYFRKTLSQVGKDSTAQINVALPAYLALARAEYTMGLCPNSPRYPATIGDARINYQMVIDIFEANNHPSHRLQNAILANIELAHSFFFTLEGEDASVKQTQLDNLIPLYQRALELSIAAKSEHLRLEAQDAILPYLLFSLCIANRDSEISPLLDSFTEIFDDPDAVRQSILDSVNLPEGCKYE